ncbi:galactokinase [Novibacillus thermophilus]|uniref:galactokinase n=1 Tax=Novibacillus thermophilus TaxID=1471761 RepID=UPI0026AB4E79
MTTGEVREALRERFIQTFDTPELTRAANGHRDDIRVFFAPGRVNLIGEHTDYTGGYVFPAALTLGTWAAVRPRQDGIYRLASVQFGGVVECGVHDIAYRREDGWANYPKGVLDELVRRLGAGVFSGADILYDGNIPNGAGLSSSASIELVTAVAVTTIASVHISMMELVKLAQRAESEFVGVNCGIMDQFAVGMGKKGRAMLLKCDTLEYEYVPFDAADLQLIITNTNKRRGLADSQYNTRRRECEEGLMQVQQVLPHVKSLGRLRYREWERIRDKIPPGAVRDRVEHVTGENARVLAAVESLKQNDFETFGHLMKESHASLRDLFDVTGKELDALYEAACRVDGCMGTRMTGAGFGGCTVSLVREDSVDRFKEQVADVYTERTGLTPTFYTCDIGGGAREIT